MGSRKRNASQIVFPIIYQLNIQQSEDEERCWLFMLTAVVFAKYFGQLGIMIGPF